MHWLKISRGTCARPDGASAPQATSQQFPPWKRLGAPLLLLALWGVAGCGSIIVPRAGNEDRYHANWWNFYRRGVAALEREAFAEARTHFETCLGLQPGARYGYDAETWRVRTYGVHFLNGYFPNRELGICLYQLQDTTKAIDYLEKSLRLAPSGRAKHYLNLAQAQHLQAQSVTPPAITFDRQSVLAWTANRQGEVAGKARGQGLIDRVIIAGEPEFIELAEAQQTFRKTVPLEPGTNWVTVTAHDLKGQQARSRIGWIADWQPPELVITRYERQGADWILEGTCQDDFGVGAISANGLPIVSPPPATRPTRVPVTLRLAAGRPLRFDARDLAGNQLQTILPPPGSDPLARLASAPRLVAVSMGRTDAGAPGLLPPAGTAPSGAGPDTQAPDLILGNTAALIKSFDEEFFLDGRAADHGGLASLTLNGRELLEAENRGALQRCFAQRLPLANGTNAFAVVVADRAGNRISRRLIVVRQEPEYLNEAFRLSLVLPPVPSDEPGPRMTILHQDLESEVLKLPARFHLLERDEGWEAILQELQLSVSDLTDPRAALRLGRLLSADLLLQTVWLRHAEGRTLYARVLDFTTGETLLDTDVYTEQEEDLTRPIAGLVMKIKQRFPLVQGMVVGLRGDQATINAGATQGLTSQTRLIACAAPDQGSEAGQVRRLDGRFVELRVRAVEDSLGRVEIVPSAARQAIQEGDHVYAR